MTNHSIIGEAFQSLREPLAGYILQQLQSVPEYKINDQWWQDGVLRVLSEFNERDAEKLSVSADYAERQDSMDITACLNLIDLHWPNLFKYRLPANARSWCKQIKNARNTWAHFTGTDFTDRETERALDTMSLLADKIDTTGETTEALQKLIRILRYGNEQGSMNAVNTAAEAAKKTSGVMQNTPVTGLPSWRNVMEPHPDVAQGRYKKAEFAADLAQVARGEGAYEYRDPLEFFSRTYVTEGIKGLLVQALRRVSGKDGEPVIQLKTAFGGGKTHSMLALYHLLRGKAPIAKAASLKAVLDAAEVKIPPICRVAVLVGTALDPSRSRREPQLPGVTINTLWGEMAAQLAVDSGVPKLYDIVKEADKKGVAPGSKALIDLFNACGPCVILIDELVAYAKNMWHKEGLPAGSFDSLITFIQSLTEAARASENSLVVASIPESEIEVGEGGGKEALAAIEHTFGRMESIWKPVAANEGFEIVRRRLFQNCKDEAKRDQVCVAFSQMYQDNASDFPIEAKEVDYLSRMRSCYPIHPEVFDRLDEDWATIEHFQKTRGVLRLMAAVIHDLWMNQDAGLMIMPGSMTLDVPAVRDELTRHVRDNWNAIVDHEVDGKDSIPYLKDQNTSRFGQLMACRRVARTIMLGSAPSERKQSVRGLEASRIRLGTIQPGENIATFNDALNTLQTSLTYLYTNSSGDRFWYDTRPTLRKTAEDRASQQSKENVEMEIERRLRKIRKERPFSRLHINPASSADVSDDQDVGLVILPVSATYKSNAPGDHAIQAALDILNNRGQSPRLYRNMLTFIAPDVNTMPSLKDAAKHFLAWQSIENEKDDLNLDAAQNRETGNMLRMYDRTMEDRIRETYCWLLVPYIDLEVSKSEIVWQTYSIRGGDDTIVTKAARKMDQNEQLIGKWAPALLLMEMDKLLWGDSDSKNIGDLWRQLCTYCYLPRLVSFEVLADAVQTGVNSDEYFSYADSVSDGRFIGLKYHCQIPFADRSGYIVKQVAALKQIAAEASRVPERPDSPDHVNLPVNPVSPVQPVDPVTPPVNPKPETLKNKRFYMTADIDTIRVNKDVSRLMDEVINHLMQVDGANVRIRLEVEADMPNGTPVPTVRTVTENLRTLHIDDYSFDD